MMRVMSSFSGVLLSANEQSSVACHVARIISVQSTFVHVKLMLASILITMSCLAVALRIFRGGWRRLTVRRIVQ